ncbi:DUF3168 domain-containing protein [Pararhizobium gei]|uniref:DUF3168 domain-containing protein n=1 Tax=Pararhizobium gei TaxID=1395951 RepID=UPI0023DC9DCA|nr:DUF3168 domain-containing protein [Rhizobium gei]
MSVELAVQIALRARFTSTPAVSALVPANHILDRNARPAPDPSIILGEDQTVDDGNSVKRDRHLVYSTIHLWKREASTAGVKAIAWAMRNALRAGRLNLGSSFHCVDCRVSSQRFMRDPDGETSHGVLTIETLAEEVA